MDEADRAGPEIDSMMQEALYKLRKQQPPKEHKGPCFCGEKEGVRFCGPECRDEYDRQERAKIRAGR